MNSRDHSKMSHSAETWQCQGGRHSCTIERRHRRPNTFIGAQLVNLDLTPLYMLHRTVLEIVQNLVTLSTKELINKLNKERKALTESKLKEEEIIQSYEDYEDSPN